MDSIALGLDFNGATGSLTLVDGVEVVESSRPGNKITMPEAVQKMVDEVVCAEPVRYMEAVGEFYLDFSEVSNEEACELIDSARTRNV